MARDAMLARSFEHRPVVWRWSDPIAKKQGRRPWRPKSGTDERSGRPLCEIERGLFYATYCTHGSDAHELPAYRLGTCAADAKQRIEETISARGYEAVIWEDTLVVPHLSLACEASACCPVDQSVDQRNGGGILGPLASLKSHSPTTSCGMTRPATK
jgi:hypothetical protein